MFRLAVIAVVTSFVGFLLHLLGTIFPYWWVLHERIAGVDVSLYYGIWIIVDCRNGTCEQMSSGMHGDRAWLIGPAVLIILANVLLCAVVICNGVYLLKRSSDPVLLKLGVILSAGAGGIIILAVLIFYKKKAGLHPSTAPETTDGAAGWALLLSTCGGIVGVINAVAGGMHVNKLSKKSRGNTIFGIKYPADLEIDVNALRKGELVQGENVNKKVLGEENT